MRESVGHIARVSTPTSAYLDSPCAGLVRDGGAPDAQALAPHSPPKVLEVGDFQRESAHAVTLGLSCGFRTSRKGAGPSAAPLRLELTRGSWALPPHTAQGRVSVRYERHVHGRRCHHVLGHHSRVSGMEEALRNRLDTRRAAPRMIHDGAMLMNDRGRRITYDPRASRAGRALSEIRMCSNDSVGGPEWRLYPRIKASPLNI